MENGQDISRNMQISGQVYKGLVTSNKREISSEALENLCHHQTLLCSSCFGLLCWILERIFIETIFVESRTIAGLSQDYRRIIAGLSQDYHRTITGLSQEYRRISSVSPGIFWTFGSADQLDKLETFSTVDC